MKLGHLFLLSITILGFSGCVPFIDVEPTPTSIPRPEWLNNLLEDPVCHPPCWENITPGLTTSEEAISILSQKPDIVNLVRTYEPSSAADFIYLDFVGKTGAGQIKLDQSDRVSYITLYVPAHHLLTTHEFEEHFENFSNVQINYCQGEYTSKLCIVDFINLDFGISASCSIWIKSGKNEQIDVKPDEEIDTINFFITDEDGYENLYPNIWYPPRTDWQGYGKYDVPIP